MSLLPVSALPELVRETARELRDEGFTCTCPAAQTDGQNIVVLCGVEREVIPVRANPLGVKMWCAGEYTECPSWRAAYAGERVVEATQQARQDARNAEMRRRHIASGLRVPDVASHETVRTGETRETLIRDVIEGS